MKLKMKLVAAAVALASANGAFAAIDNAASGNGELFLSVFDAAKGISYTRDLGINMDSFLSGGALAPANNTALAFNAAATVAAGGGNVTDNNGYKLTFGADSLLTSSLGTGGLLSGNAIWSIGAMDNTGTNRYLTTVAVGTAASAMAGVTNSILKGYGVQGGGYISAANLLGTETQANGSNVATVADGNAYFDTSLWGTNWGGKSPVVNAGTVGQNLDFYLLSTVGTSNTGKISVSQYANAQGAATWNLASNGTLTYLAAPVPEADTWALFGAGLLMVGAIARRRMSV